MDNKGLLGSIVPGDGRIFQGQKWGRYRGEGSNAMSLRSSDGRSYTLETLQGLKEKSGYGVGAYMKLKESIIYGVILCAWKNGWDRDSQDTKNVHSKPNASRHPVTTLEPQILSKIARARWNFGVGITTVGIPAETQGSKSPWPEMHTPKKNSFFSIQHRGAI